MLLMMNFDSTVGIADRWGGKDSRWTMLKICVALNKEKGIRFLPDLSIGVTKGESRHMRKSCCYCKSQIGLCQEVGKAQYLRRIKQRIGTNILAKLPTSTAYKKSLFAYDFTQVTQTPFSLINAQRK